jgi:hypothetical protein
MTMHHPNQHEIANVRKSNGADFKDFEIENAIKRAIPDEHQWDRGAKEGVRIHDWREHVGTAVRREWKGMNFPTRVAIALDAETAAGHEIWE